MTELKLFRLAGIYLTSLTSRTETSTAHGGAFNRYTGEGSIADQGLRKLYEADVRNRMKDREKRTTLAEAREKNRPKGGGRRGGGRRGGGHKRGGARYVEQERHGVLGQLNTQTGKWTPYSKSVQEGRTAPEPQDTGEFKPNARRLKALEQWRNGKISYDELVRVR